MASPRERRAPLRDVALRAAPRGRASASNDLSANSPFAAQSDGAAARRAPLERRLLDLNIERDLLDSELDRLPEHAKTYAERQRRRAAEDRKRDLDSAANHVKFALRSTAPL